MEGLLLQNAILFAQSDVAYGFLVLALDITPGVDPNT